MLAIGSFGSISRDSALAAAGGSPGRDDGAAAEPGGAGREVTSSTGASSGGTTFVFPLAGAPAPVRRTPIGSASSSAVGTMAGMRGPPADGVLAAAVAITGISSRRGSAVAAVGRSLTRLDSSSGFLPLAANFWIVKPAMTISVSTNRPSASRPFFETARRWRSATFGIPASPGSGAMVFGSSSGPLSTRSSARTGSFIAPPRCVVRSTSCPP